MIERKFLNKKELSKVKKELSGLLKELGLDSLVTLKEVEHELRHTEKIQQSLLLIGLVTRCTEEKKDDLMMRLIPLLTHWKNFLPGKELNGLSPAEYEEKYPRGELELAIMEELMQSYQDKLQGSKRHGPHFDIHKDFAEFQKTFLGFIPANQPFPDAPKMLTNDEIIIEERKRLSHPRKKLKNISVSIFADNIAEELGDEIARLDDTFMTAMDEMIFMQMNPKQRSRKKIKRVLKDLENLEPYMKCGQQSFRFYLNFANVAFLNNEVSRAIKLLEQSVIINPQYKEGKEALKRFKEYKDTV